LDIKLKNFNKNRILKTLVFFICVVSFLGSLTGMGLIYNTSSIHSYGQSIDDLLLYENYKDSAEFQREFDEKLSTVLYLLDQYKSEEYIKTGSTVSNDELETAIESLYYEKAYNGRQYVDQYGNNSEYLQVQDQFKKDYKADIAELKESMIMDDLRDFRESKKQLTETEGFTYYATDGTAAVTNLNLKTTDSAVDVSAFQNKPAYMIYQNDEMIKNPVEEEGNHGWMKSTDKILEDRLDGEYEPNLKVYLSFDDQFIAAKETEYNAAKAELMKWLPMTVSLGILALASLIYLIVITGRKDENGIRPVHKIDRIYTEFQLIIIAILFVFGGVSFGKFLLETVNYGIYFNNSLYVNNDPLALSITLASVIGLFSASAGLLFILSCVRNIKNGRFIKNSILIIVFSSLYKGIKSVYYGGSLMRKVVLITLLICLGSATVALAPVFAILIIVFAPKLVKKFEEVKKGVNEVKSGNLTYKIPAEGDGELDKLARGINQISEASNAAIQNELKNQRMKTDLISNVSHDLKTPLTSIITYIDLLKREGLDSADAPKYLDILDQKSIRLQKLTEDLFDAAKASSGAIPVKFERVDLLSLINQGLGEMSDRIETSNLEFKINADKEKYYVNADGQLLWRVVENLLGNVLKYAQENSRVYIDLKEQSGKNGKVPMTVLEIKNISKAELNIDADELMERFKRGDESRSTEGSGLGLAIAKDLVRLQNGWFEIKIDGDLFKAVVMLEAYSSTNYIL